MSRLHAGWIVALALLAGHLSAGEIYRSTGPYGEARFSDVETPDAATVIVDPPAPAAADGGDWVAETLAVARELEASRLAREAAAAERREAYRKRQQTLVPATPVEDRTRYSPLYTYPYYWGPGYPHRPPFRPGRPDHRPIRPDHPPGRPQEPSRPAPIPWSGPQQEN